MTKTILTALIAIVLITTSQLVKAQTAPQTYWTPGVPPGSTSFSPTFRFIGTDSTASFCINNSNRWSLIYTAAQSNSRFLKSNAIVNLLSGTNTWANNNTFQLGIEVGTFGGGTHGVQFDGTTYSTSLYANSANTSNVIDYLPASGGTLALTADLVNFPTFSGNNTFTGNNSFSKLFVGNTSAFGDNYGQVMAARIETATLTGNTVGYISQINRIASNTASWYLGTNTNQWGLIASNARPFTVGTDYSGLYTENFHWNPYAGFSSNLVLDGVSTTLSGFGYGILVNPTVYPGKNSDAIYGMLIAPSLSTGASAISSLGTITQSGSFINGTYSNIPVNGGSGGFATATVTVAGNVITSVQIVSGGNGFVVGDNITFSSNSLGGSSGTVSVPVNAVGLTGITSYALGVQGSVDMKGNSIKNVAAGVSSTDAANFSQVSNKAIFIQVSTYAAMIANGTPSQMTIYKVLTDENKGMTQQIYQWWPDGKRIWMATTTDN